MAPEILNSCGYGCKVDIFSLGVIMYILLTSKFVFSARDYNEILRKNKQCKVVFAKKLWENISPEAQDLCKRMLQKDPAYRVTAVEALNHKWFKMFNKDPNSTSREFVSIEASKDAVKVEKNIFNLGQK